MKMNGVRRGTGKPLILFHGLGSTWRSWRLVLDQLAAHREVFAIDLPGFGKTPPLKGPATIATFAEAVTDFLDGHDMLGADVVGSSMGGCLALELARRGLVGSAVALGPAGFCEGWERTYTATLLGMSIRLARRLKPVLPFLIDNSVGRTLLLSHVSPRPRRLPLTLLLDEKQSSIAAPSYDAMRHELAYGTSQQGPAPGARVGPITIGWGRQDRICLPRQAARAMRQFPTAHLHWFDRCGHIPQWDSPEETARLILERTGGALVAPAASLPDRFALDRH